MTIQSPRSSTKATPSPPRNIRGHDIFLIKYDAREDEEEGKKKKKKKRGKRNNSDAVAPEKKQRGLRRHTDGGEGYHRPLYTFGYIVVYDNVYSGL